MDKVDHLIVEIEQWAREAKEAFTSHKEALTDGMWPDIAESHGRIYDVAIQSMDVLAERLRGFRGEEGASAGQESTL